MFQTKSEYDRGVNTFSPEGRLFQVEYAISAVKVGQSFGRAYGLERPLCSISHGGFDLIRVLPWFRARQLGSTAVGIKTAEGVVLCVEKRVTSTLLEPTSVEKIMEVDTHIGARAATVSSPSRRRRPRVHHDPCAAIAGRARALR